jgi:hypothetical protein
MPSPPPDTVRAMKDRQRNIAIVGIAVVGCAVALSVGALAGDEDDERPTLSALEAACQMIADGDTAVEAFDILRDLDVPELTASRAVNRAIAGDC